MQGEAGKLVSPFSIMKNILTCVLSFIIGIILGTGLWLAIAIFIQSLS